MPGQSEHAERLIRTERALGALYGLAIGDALGMPTQTFSRERIVARFGRVDGFEPGPPENEISAGLPAGSVTDDTDQALIVARALVRGGGSVDRHELAAALMAWERRMAERGSLDLLGPSTRLALERFAAGDVEAAGRDGATNGAAMRIAPVGVATRGRALLLERVAGASRLTHDTPVAIAGAAAVAGAVSAGIDGADTAAALRAGGELATASADVARRVAWRRGARRIVARGARRSTRSPRASARASPRRRPCPPPSRWRRRIPAIRGRRAWRPRTSAGTPTRSARWRAR